jgi:hypothetical protein
VYRTGDTPGYRRGPKAERALRNVLRIPWDRTCRRFGLAVDQSIVPMMIGRNG